MKKKHLVSQLLLLGAVVLTFALINLWMYCTVTRRLSNNFSDTSQAGMVDVENYLPFTQAAKLVHREASLKLTENLPVLDGAAALVPVYAAFVEAVYPEDSVTYEGGNFSADNFYGENFASDSSMQYKNTIRGFKAVVDGETDIFFCAAPSEDQLRYMRDQGVELVFEPIGREAFVFFVNAQNPVEGLTAQQIRQIYAGQIRNWNRVGGPDRAINPVTRLAGSGSQTTMEKFMGDTGFGAKSLLAPAGASLGFSFRYYLETMVRNGEVKMLAVNGVTPDTEHIRSGEYPIVAEFYAAYRADNTNPNVKKMIQWILSEEGQEIIEETGYVGR